MALLSPCLGTSGHPCGKPSPRGGCPRHRREREAAHHNARYDGSWRAFSERIRANHVARFGYVCPGTIGHPAHMSRDLTVDHITRLADGGALLDPRNVRVLCKSHNSRLGAIMSHANVSGRRL